VDPLHASRSWSSSTVVSFLCSRRMSAAGLRGMIRSTSAAVLSVAAVAACWNRSGVVCTGSWERPRRPTWRSGWRGSGSIRHARPGNPTDSARRTASSRIARCLALTKPVGSSGVAILPYHPSERWSRDAMGSIQRFMSGHGCVVGEMLRSATTVFDRVEQAEVPYLDVPLPPAVTSHFYGSANRLIPRGIGLDGTILHDRPAIRQVA
jgi:hypothetical protein